MSVDLSEVLAEYKDEKSALIIILQKGQQQFAYLSGEAISEIPRVSGI